MLSYFFAGGLDVAPPNRRETREYDSYFFLTSYFIKQKPTKAEYKMAANTWLEIYNPRRKRREKERCVIQYSVVEIAAL